ncbi:MAG: hypothetical protein ACREMY_17065 [bacterium]
MSSKHLDEILDRHNQITNALVVVADIEKYSQRRTLAQVAVVEAFTSNVAGALEDVSKEYVTYAQKNSVNFETDILRLPTGDGVVVAFPFDGIPDIHLQFARALVGRVGESNAENDCARFAQDGWCNCHANHNIRVGIDEGKSVIYRDVNSDYNIAGNAINLSARVMAEADPNQILLSGRAYSQLIDLVSDPALSDKFRAYQDIGVKHGLRIGIHQYMNEDDQFLNTSLASDPALQEEMSAASEMLKGGMPLIPSGADPIEQGRAVVEAMKMLGSIGSTLQGSNNSAAPGPGELPEQPTDDRVES